MMGDVHRTGDGRVGKATALRGGSKTDIEFKKLCTISEGRVCIETPRSGGTQRNALSHVSFEGGTHQRVYVVQECEELVNERTCPTKTKAMPSNWLPELGVRKVMRGNFAAVMLVRSKSNVVTTTSFFPRRQPYGHLRGQTLFM